MFDFMITLLNRALEMSYKSTFVSPFYAPFDDQCMRKFMIQCLMPLKVD